MIRISEDRRITDPRHLAVLPSSYGTLYELTLLSDFAFELAVQEGVLRPDIERDEVLALKKKQPSSQAKTKGTLLVTISQEPGEIDASDLQALKSAVLSIIDLPSFLVAVSPKYKRLVAAG